MIGSLVVERDCTAKIMVSSVEASGPCRAKTCCFRRRLAGAPHSSSTSNLQAVNQMCCGCMHMIRMSPLQDGCHASAGLKERRNIITFPHCLAHASSCEP